ncbi:hypothetical protein MYX65_03705 [Acidobacteria bacterium AH-259-L09]|nr:hypothetical protein [Acidobacteria bacterium AH-259-L09]
MDEKDVHEAYRTYRNAAIVFATTIVAACGVIVAQVRDDLLRGSLLALIVSLPFLATMLFGLYVQYCNIRGSTYFARWFYEQFRNNEQQAKKEKSCSDEWFKRLDRKARVTFWLFAASIASASVILVGRVLLAALT